MSITNGQAIKVDKRHSAKFILQREGIVVGVAEGGHAVTASGQQPAVSKQSAGTPASFSFCSFVSVFACANSDRISRTMPMNGFRGSRGALCVFFHVAGNFSRNSGRKRAGFVVLCSLCRSSVFAGQKVADSFSQSGDPQTGAMSSFLSRADAWDKL